MLADEEPASPRSASKVSVEVIGGSEAAEALFASLTPAARDLARHALDPRERVREARAGEWRLLVLRVPKRDGRAVAFETMPLGIVLGGDRALVLCAEENEVTRAMRVAAPGADVLHVAFCATAEAFHTAVEEIERAVDAVEERMTRSLVNREVITLLHFQKALVHHTAALRATIELVDRLCERTDPSGEKTALSEVKVELRQALEVADLERETLGATMDTLATVVSNNLNDVMRVLTGATLVLTPPIAVAGMWGMNVALPMEHSPEAFWFLLALSLAGSAAIAGALRVKGWL